MVKHVGSSRPEDTTRLYPDSYRNITVMAYPGKDIEYIGNQVNNINPRNFPEFDAVYILAGTNNIKGKCTCDWSDFEEYLDDLIFGLREKFPGVKVFVNQILPRFDGKKRHVSNVILPKIDHFNEQLFNLQDEFNFTLISKPFHPVSYTHLTLPTIYSV